MQTTPLRKETRSRQGYRPLFFVAWGLLFWFASTLTLRLAGQWFLVPTDTMRLAAAYYGSIPLIAALTFPVYRLRRLPADSQIRAAILIALPGMLLHMVTTLVFDRLFPNLPPGAGRAFTSWLLWSYGLILLSGFLHARQSHHT